jgi:hypothetical protein
MTDRAARNQENSPAAFFAKKAEFDALLAELTQASADHLGADAERCAGAKPHGFRMPRRS